MRPIHDNKNLSQAIEASFECGSLQEAIGYVCMWEEYRRTGISPNLVGEPCFGHVVAELLKIYGIDINNKRLTHRRDAEPNWVYKEPAPRYNRD